WHWSRRRKASSSRSRKAGSASSSRSSRRGFYADLLRRSAGTAGNSVPGLRLRRHRGGGGRDTRRAGAGVYLARGACRSADACRGAGESERHGGRRTGYHGPRSGHSRSRRRQMALQVRRVITGHDANGKAIVKIDEVSKNAASGRPGATACNIWTTEGFAANNDGAADEGLR